MHLHRISSDLPASLRIELWDQARHDLACLSERERLQLESRLRSLAEAASVRRRHLSREAVQEEEELPTESEQRAAALARLHLGQHELRLRFDWERGVLEVTGITPQDDD